MSLNLQRYFRCQYIFQRNYIYSLYLKKNVREPSLTFLIKIILRYGFLIQIYNNINIPLQCLLFIVLFPKTQCSYPLRFSPKTCSRTYYCWWTIKTGWVRVVIRSINDQLYFLVYAWTNRNAYQSFIWCLEYHADVTRIFVSLALVPLALWRFSDALRRGSCISAVIYCL